MLKLFYSKKSGAVSVTAAAVISSVTVLTAIASLGAAKVTLPKNPAVIIEDGIANSMYTHAADLEGFVAEQRAKLHPFDNITYAGLGEDGEFEIAVDRAPYVLITDGSRVRNVRAIKGETVGELMAREWKYAGEHDSTSPAPETRITGNCEITVTEAFPVTISADNKVIETLAAGITVGDLLIREGITLGGYDELNCTTDEIVHDHMNIAVSRVEYKERQKSQTIPFETEYTESVNMGIGDSKVVVEGQDGLATITIKEKYVNGAKVSSEVTDTKMEDAVNEVVARGTAIGEPYSKREGNFTLKDGIPTEYVKKLDGKVTAYYAPAGSGTYSGRPLVVGSVGVDPDVIPFGSEVYIVSKDGTHVYGYAVASDTGDIKGSGVLCDAYMGTTYDDCLWWQAQFCDVYILSVGDNSVSWR